MRWGKPEHPDTPERCSCLSTPPCGWVLGKPLKHPAARSLRSRERSAIVPRRARLGDPAGASGQGCRGGSPGLAPGGGKHQAGLHGDRQESDGGGSAWRPGWLEAVWPWCQLQTGRGEVRGDWAVILKVRLTVPKTHCFGRSVNCHQESPQDQSRGLEQTEPLTCASAGSYGRCQGGGSGAASVREALAGPVGRALPSEPPLRP